MARLFTESKPLESISGVSLAQNSETFLKSFSGVSSVAAFVSSSLSSPKIDCVLPLTPYKTYPPVLSFILSSAYEFQVKFVTPPPVNSLAALKFFISRSRELTVSLYSWLFPLGATHLTTILFVPSASLMTLFLFKSA